MWASGIWKKKKHVEKMQKMALHYETIDKGIRGRPRKWLKDSSFSTSVRLKSK
jgi:hypothetical protein